MSAVLAAASPGLLLVAGLVALFLVARLAAAFWTCWLQLLAAWRHHTGAPQ